MTHRLVAAPADLTARPVPWSAAVYTSGLVAWAVGPDRGQSLTKDLHPVHAGLVVAAALAYVVRWAVARRSLSRGR